MLKGHIKITLEDINTKNIAIFNLDMINKGVDINLDNFDPDLGSDLFLEMFKHIIESTGLKEKFVEAISDL